MNTNARPFTLIFSAAFMLILNATQHLTRSPEPQVRGHATSIGTVQETGYALIASVSRLMNRCPAGLARAPSVFAASLIRTAMSMSVSP